MEKRVYLNGGKTDFILEDTGRLYNEKTKRWLKGGINKGYHFYSLYFRGKPYILYTHRAVAEYFIPNPENLPIVHHLDGNRLNNIYTNLCWCSIQEHAIFHQNEKKEKTPRQYCEVDFSEMAQFRNSPYYATKDGEIINVSKRIKMRLEKTGNYYRFAGGYNLGRKHFLVHRVVWEAFNGKIPEGYNIDHIDGNPKNNSLSNLQAISHKENIKKRDIDWSFVVNNFNQNKKTTGKRSSTNGSGSEKGDYDKK